MATTKYKIAEQILLLLNGGRSPDASKFHINEIKIAVEQAANQLLKVEYLSVNMPMGEMIPNGAAIATYENILVTQYGTVSKSKLPCFPLKLPRGMGVYQIFNPSDVTCPFIPLETGMASLIKSEPVLSTLFNYTGYEVYGATVVYTKDLSVPNTDVFVNMRLVVLDMSQYTDFDLLPLAPEQEVQVINLVLSMYGQEPVADKLDDPGVKEQRGPLNQQIQA